MQRRTLLATLIGLIFANGQARTTWAMGAKPVPPGVFRLSGKVEINGKPAREGSPVHPGDTVTTGERSEVIFVVGQDAFLQHANSTVTLLGKTIPRGLRILSGRLLSVFGHGEKELQTSTATIGIRGTACYIESKVERTYFCLCYGIAEIVPNVRPDRREVIETRHHDRPLFIEANPQHPFIPAPVVDHTDDELTLLENLVGRYPPFFGKPDLYR